MRADMDRGSWVDPARARKRFEAWAREYGRTRVNLRPSTRTRDDWVMEQLVLPVFGGRAMGSIGPMDIRSWVTSLEAEYAASTVRKAYQVLARVLKAAVEADVILRSPCRGIDLPKTEHQEMRFLSTDEVAALVRATRHRWAPFVLTAAYTGLRWGELAALRLPRLDLLSRYISVEETVIRDGGSLSFGPPKTRAAIRRISIPAFVGEALAAHLGEYPAVDGLVFGRMNPSRFRQRVWYPAVDASVGRPCRVHDLRHSHAAMLIREKAHPKAIQVRLGHASIKTTLDTYGHLYEGIDEALAEALDATWRKATEPGDAA
ncbi:MAG: integrase family protein [Actinobacteria bacterium]|nr:integrase family protein [Actinomycetota bacterium]